MESIAVKERQIVFACANPHSLVKAQTDHFFLEALNSADQVVADGVGISLVAKLIGREITPRITGSDYFFSVMRALDEKGDGKVFFLGSTEHVLERVKAEVRLAFPSIDIDTYSPPFGEWDDESNQTIIQAINTSKPDLLWVGMTAPRQEKWVHKNRDNLDVPVIGSIGAVFDFVAGTHVRAPKWMHSLGFEWLYRFMREPRRMWRRNFVSSPRFVWLVLQERIKGH
jgi:N-acetylglucosaminyldiphosphoundecaprenol N-acetyl-beta-D-mannosaminyltransferase